MCCNHLFLQGAAGVLTEIIYNAIIAVCGADLMLSAVPSRSFQTLNGIISMS